MTSTERPAVQRVQPPKGPYVVVNRVVRWLLSSPRRSARVGGRLLVLHVTGRQSGREIDVPVAYREVPGGRLRVLTSARWRVNLRGREQVEVTLRGHRSAAGAELVEDPEKVAQVFGELIAEQGYAKAQRRMGIRINVDRAPTHAELVEAARRDGLSVIYLTVAGPWL